MRTVIERNHFWRVELAETHPDAEEVARALHEQLLRDAALVERLPQVRVDGRLRVGAELEVHALSERLHCSVLVVGQVLVVVHNRLERSLVADHHAFAKRNKRKCSYK